MRLIEKSIRVLVLRSNSNYIIFYHKHVSAQFQIDPYINVKLMQVKVFAGCLLVLRSCLLLTLFVFQLPMWV